MTVIRTFANTQSIIRARVKHDRCLNPLFKTRIVYDIRVEFFGMPDRNTMWDGSLP